MSPVLTTLLACGALLLPVLTAEPGATTQHDLQDPAANSYIGQKVCASCHKAAEAGSIHQTWAGSRHAKAFETLASEEAKAIAAKLEIDDAQKADDCLKCHVTAFGVDKKQIKRTFEPENGVQCETCHGPGHHHRRTRVKAAMAEGDPVPVGPDEFTKSPGPDVCKQCHNEASPTYEGFCFKEMAARIEHLDPRKERTPEELKKLRERCTPDCPKCSKQKDDGDGGE